MTKHGYLERVIMQIRSQTGHLFVYVCSLQNEIRSHCSQFTLTPTVDSMTIVRVHFDLIYNFYVYIKLVMRNHILVKFIILINFQF